MHVDRRTALKVFATGTATLAGVRPAEARERKEAPFDAKGMLYDATRCIGCKACVVACREANDLSPEPGSRLYDAAVDLSGHTASIIKLAITEDEGPCFVKQQCMQCLDPACASACMLGSLQKREYGIVTWIPDRCIGCRYCQIACPFEIPKFEWDSAMPRIVKCQMCLARAGSTEEGVLEELGQPACCEVCPRDAVIYGDYREIVSEAKQRLEREPERYYPKVYGLEEAGGTQVLYLSRAGVSFQDLGLPDLGPDPIPKVPVTLQHTIYKGFVAPLALYGVLAGLVWRARRLDESEHPPGEEAAS